VVRRIGAAAESPPNFAVGFLGDRPPDLQPAGPREPVGSSAAAVPNLALGPTMNYHHLDTLFADRGGHGAAMADDREEFETHKNKQAAALGRDKEVFGRTLETLVDLDRYDYTYLWSWLGVPIIQLPADVMATQEVIWKAKPDVIIETGVARGGSMIFLASMLELRGHGQVIGVDIDIRPHNREAIMQHPLSRRVTLIEGGSTDGNTLANVRSAIPDGSKVMVILDSDHGRNHVLAELRAYAPFVSQGQYLVVADTVLGYFTPQQTPRKRSKIWTPGDDPLAALRAYMDETDRFEVDPVVNGKLVLASSPSGFLKCVKPV
jgi:cephalosporin hydroxylase